MTSRPRGIVAMGAPAAMRAIASGGGYECASRIPEMEYGSCIPFNWEHQTRNNPAAKSLGSVGSFGGYATRFNKVHLYKGRFEVFSVGAFAKSICGGNEIRFLEDHDEAKCLAVTGQGLRVWADAVGLSFKVKLPNTLAGERILNEVKTHKKLSMSIGYEKVEVEEESVGGEQVYFIRSARINEISIVSAGAVRQAFIEALPPDDDFNEPYQLTKGLADCSGSLARLGECIARTSDALKQLTK